MRWLLLLGSLVALVGCDSSTPGTAVEDAGAPDTGPPVPLGEICITENSCGGCGKGEACVTDWDCKPGSDGGAACDFAKGAQQLGDDRCHKTCEKGETCGSGETCKHVAFFGCTTSNGSPAGKAICVRQ